MCVNGASNGDSLIIDNNVGHSAELRYVVLGSNVANKAACPSFQLGRMTLTNQMDIVCDVDSHKNPFLL